MRQALKRRVASPKQYTYYAFDIETRKDGSLIEGAIGSITEQWFFQDMRLCLEHMERLTGKRVRFLAHWADGMEFPHLIQTIRSDPELRVRYQLFPLLSGDRMVQLKLINNQTKSVIIINDTYALANCSLAKWSKTFGGDYVKHKDIDFTKREYAPATDRDYLIRDIQSPIASILEFTRLVSELFESDIGVTAASTAMRAFQASIPEGFVYFRLNRTAESFCRAGYWGGYVYPGYDNKVHHDIVSRDITGAYGARMKYLFPVGNPTYSYFFKHDKQGMWNCDITCTGASLPIVPYRDEKGSLRWLGTLGRTVNTTVTTDEIVYFEQHGYSVVVREGYYWDRSEYVFRDFIEKCEQLEQRGGAYKDIAKLMRNSLYGRFGSRPQTERVIITQAPPDGAELYSDPHSGMPFEDIYTITEEIDAGYIQPHWAAYITSYQRLALFEMIFRVGVENVYGADTDSIKLERQIDEFLDWKTDTYYGSTHIEARYDLYRSMGPKNYVTTRDAVFGCKLKGIPQRQLSQDMLAGYLSTFHLEVKGYTSLTKGLTMLKKDGKLPLQTARDRSIAGLHSQQWAIDDASFFICV